MPFPGFGASYRPWKNSLARWTAATSFPVDRHADKVLKTLTWELQTEIFDTIANDDLSSSNGVEMIITCLDEKAGVRADDELRRALRGVLYGTERRRDESLTEYVIWRDRQFDLVAAFEVKFPSC
jgi:hypothetical protein